MSSTEIVSKEYILCLYKVKSYFGEKTTDVRKIFPTLNEANQYVKQINTDAYWLYDIQLIQVECRIVCKVKQYSTITAIVERVWLRDMVPNINPLRDGLIAKGLLSK